MNISQLRKRVLQAGVALPAMVLLGAGLPTAALAQEEDQEVPVTGPTEEDVDASDANSPTLVVTGSRIRRPNLESTVPITSIGGESFLEQGDTNIGDTLNELPQLRSTFAQQNPGLGIGIAGLNLLDLRGLGTTRTLVLVNGRRHVAADILNFAVSPDVNSIPNDLIERVDIVTGGNSAIYGSDAIAGVVNFVLRRDFDGIQIRGQAGVSPEGFGGNQYISAMYGTNFADDRANVTVHAEYANQERIFGSELPWLRQVDNFGVVDVDSTGLPFGSDGFPDSIFLRDIRSASINRFGLIPITQRDNPATTGNEALCGTGAGASNGATSPIGGIPYNCTFLFDPSGSLAAQTGARFGSGVIGGILGGNGQTGREGRLLSIQPEVQRYNFNLLAHFTVSEAFEPFIEAKWVRVDAIGGNASPTAFQGTFAAFDFRERLRLDNPFLTPAQRTTIANALTTSGCAPSFQFACQTGTGAFSAPTVLPANGQTVAGPLGLTDLAAIAAGTYRFTIGRTLADLPNRDERFRRDTYRVVGGVRGSFFDDWSYEASVNYGRFDQEVFTFGFLDKQRFMLSLDAGRNPVTGAIQCRSQFDPAAAIAFDQGAYYTGAFNAVTGLPAPRTSPSQPGRLAADIAACVPYNPFGGTDNTAAANYFQVNTQTTAKLSQFVVSGFVGGDLSQLFELPGGPVRFAVGAEYRREEANYIDDPFVKEGSGTLNTQSNTNNVVISDFLPPAFEVKEAFGEIQIPLLADLPFADELTLSGAVRYADYSGATGGVWAYNAGIDWAPIRDVRFRGNYSRAVRAPNLSELFFPIVPNFAPGFTDPCASTNIANNPNRAANCLADIGSAALVANLPTNAYSLNVLSGSNPDLTEETSDSWTIGAIVQPRWVPGLSLSVDYYNIKVEDVIVSLTAQQIANNCYDQPDIDNIFCSLFTRYSGTGAGPFGEQPGQIAGNSLVQAGVNFAASKRRGVDVNLAYRTNLSDDFTLNANLIATHNLENSNFQNPARPDFENRLLGELGDPKNEARLDLDLGYGDFTFGYRMRYIGKMFTSAYENFNELFTACPTPGSTVGCPPLNLDVAEPRQTPSTFYHDVRVEYDIDGRFQFYGGVDNVLNTHAPLGLSGTGSFANGDRGGGTAAIYDAFGRKVYAGFKANF